jgi:hypothetical protein
VVTLTGCASGPNPGEGDASEERLGTENQSESEEGIVSTTTGPSSLFPPGPASDHATDGEVLFSRSVTDKRSIEQEFEQKDILAVDARVRDGGPFEIRLTDKNGDTSWVERIQTNGNPFYRFEQSGSSTLILNSNEGQVRTRAWLSNRPLVSPTPRENSDIPFEPKSDGVLLDTTGFSQRFDYMDIAAETTLHFTMSNEFGDRSLATLYYGALDDRVLNLDVPADQSTQRSLKVEREGRYWVKLIPKGELRLRITAGDKGK